MNEHGNEPSVYIKGRTFLDELRKLGFSEKKIIVIYTIIQATIM
jgi:hypothetical protein